jgi:integrase
LEAGRWKRAAERNKQNKATDTPLIAPAINLLKEMKRTADGAAPSDRLFKGVRLRFFWSRVTQQAGLPDLRIHDLRHVFASVLLGGGAPMDSIAQLLGHASTRMTEIYANRSADNLKQIADMASANLGPRALPAPRVRRNAA